MSVQLSCLKNNWNDEAVDFFLICRSINWLNDSFFLQLNSEYSSVSFCKCYPRSSLYFRHPRLTESVNERADGAVNEWSTEWISNKGCQVWCKRCNVGVLYPGRSEGSHELKMWILCNMSERLLYHSELQLPFHINYYTATVVMVVP